MATRRNFIKQAAALATLGHTPLNMAAPQSATPAEPKSLTLHAASGTVSLLGADYPNTDVWHYNGTIPGPEIRLKHGSALRVKVENSLPEATSVHWHGIRLPNAMDGVAGLTQAPIQPGESFLYEFTPPDAGSYWYHAHLNTPEQIGRGLYGPLIIDEPNPPPVDRDWVWMIDDWRLQKDASISDDFRNRHDSSHAGRIGNAPTLNGQYKPTLSVRSGERHRIRIINAANARNFALNFDQLAPWVIAIDGQPVTPYQTDQAIVIGASGRVDLLLDITTKPGQQTKIIDNYYRQPYLLATFDNRNEKPLSAAPTKILNIQQAQLPEPDLDNAVSYEVVIAGGAMGGLRHAMLDDKWTDIRNLAQRGYVWALNDIVGNKLAMPPLIDVARGTTVRLLLQNDTAFAHPMHLHGHHLKLISIDGALAARTQWHDSPLIAPSQRMELAFVADNPGHWLFHCHILEHHASGMGALLRVR